MSEGRLWPEFEANSGGFAVLEGVEKRGNCKVTGNITVSQNHGGSLEGDSRVDDAFAARLDTDWHAIASGLRRDLGAQIYGQWIRSIALGNFCNLTGTLELFLPSDFSASWVSDQYAERLRMAWNSSNNHVKQIKIRTRPGAARVEMLRSSGVPERPAAQHIAEALPVRSALDPRMTFANFVKGQTNVLALSAAERVASVEKPLFNPPIPQFIWHIIPRQICLETPSRKVWP